MADNRHGVEDFSWGNSSWCFLAVRAPHPRVAEAILGRSDILAYEPNAPTQTLTTDLSIVPSREQRTTFLLQLADGTWTLLIRTVHWLGSADSWLVASMALELSVRLLSPAICGVQDDAGLPEFRLFERGKEAVRANPIVGQEQTYYRRRAQFDSYFERNGLYVPAAFIDTAGTLFLCDADRRRLTAADRITFSVPPGDQVEERRIVYRLENLELPISSASLPAIND